MKNFHENFEQEIFSYIKTKLQKFLDAGKILEISPLLEEALEFIGLESVEVSSLFIKEVKSWYLNITTLSYLVPVFEYFGNDLNEIIIHGPHYIKAFSKKEERIFDCDLSFQDLKASLEILALCSQSSWNYSHPIVSFSATVLGRRSRVTLVHHSVLTGSKLTACLRFHSEEVFFYKDFCLKKERFEWICSNVHAKKNILISGATKSGKTSFLKLLLSHISPHEHIISIEDTSELNLSRHHFTSLINKENSQTCELKELCRQALRLSPDRIILGEMRGPEALSFLLAMNTGHQGLMSTLHANSAQDALERVCLLFHFYSQQQSLEHEFLIDMICRNIDIVIHLENKKVVSIIEVRGSEKGRAIYSQLHAP